MSVFKTIPKYKTWPEVSTLSKSIGAPEQVLLHKKTPGTSNQLPSTAYHKPGLVWSPFTYTTILKSNGNAKGDLQVLPGFLWQVQPSSIPLLSL